MWIEKLGRMEGWKWEVKRSDDPCLPAGGDDGCMVWSKVEHVFEI
jgi:hypothetical protein